MSKAEIDVQVRQVHWCKEPNPLELRLKQLLKKYDFKITLDDHLAGAHLVFDQAGSGTILLDSHVVLETRYGGLAMDNYREVLQALMGIPIKQLDCEQVLETLSLYLPSLPKAFVNTFGQITADASSIVDEKATLMRMRLSAEDCSIACTLAASAKFWLEVLSQEHIERTAKDYSNDLCLTPTVAVVLGEVTLTRKELGGISMGDVIRLDKTLFDESGRGSISLGEQMMTVDWIARGNPEKFLVIERKRTYE